MYECLISLTSSPPPPYYIAFCLTFACLHRLSLMGTYSLFQKIKSTTSHIFCTRTALENIWQKEQVAWKTVNLNVTPASLLMESKPLFPLLPPQRAFTETFCLFPQAAGNLKGQTEFRGLRGTQMLPLQCNTAGCVGSWPGALSLKALPDPAPNR